MNIRVLIVGFLVISFFGRALSQDLSNLFPIAHWPLLNSPEDALGQVGPLELLNVTLDPANGAYSNGIYVGGDPDVGSYIQSQHLEALYDDKFAITLNFKIEELTGMDQPVIILGLGYRYLGFEVQFDNTFRVVLNNADYIPLPGVSVSAGVAYDLIMIHDALADNTEVYLNSILIGEVPGHLDRIPGDGQILNSHPGTGKAFKGYWRDLRVYGSDEISSLREDILARSKCTVFPNPAFTTIRFTAISPDDYQYQIFDLQGTMRSSQNLHLPEEAVDIGILPEGLYFVNLSRRADGLQTGCTSFFKRD